MLAIPAFGRPELTGTVLGDLLGHPPELVPNVRIVVVDNAGDYAPAKPDERIEIHVPGGNLRWIGTANWALTEASGTGAAYCVVLNNDVRLSPDYLYGLLRTFRDCTDVALAASCYDDFWLHQCAAEIPDTAADYRPVLSYRSVPFCDGTGLAFSIAAADTIGLLDTTAFPRHGYGSDIDYAIRARALGMRCVVTDSAYLSHLRRGTMNTLPEETSEQNRAEILTGMDGKWGSGWRARAGLGPGAFPPHNTGSGESWYV